MNLLVDIATGRIVHYSESAIPPTENTVMAYYKDTMPFDITPNNCWNWRLVGTELIKVNTPTQFGINKQSLINQINKRCDEEYKKLISQTFVNDIRNELYSSQDLVVLNAISTANGKDVGRIKDEYKLRMESRRSNVAIIEFIRSRFLTATNFCEHIEELDSVKKSFAEAIFTKEYVSSPDRFLITTIQTDVDVEELLTEVVVNNDWDVFTKRQVEIEVQKDTQSIPLIAGVPLSNLPWPNNLWDSSEVSPTTLYERYPKIVSWLNDFAEQNNLEIARVAIVKLMVDGQVGSHIDVGEYYRPYRRYHLCLQGCYKYSVLFKEILANAGTLFSFDNKNSHKSSNVGTVPRISIIFDAKKKTS